ncbi:hypothetical protein [Achromobacter insolitus]|uniref:hypothetical protein n=1 Tax=Achromobacter insolitus TaxID=217204 RepID=UPI0020C6A9F2|nr:hypothetical protein [Achromobacter insolitus]
MAMGTPANGSAAWLAWPLARIAGAGLGQRTLAVHGDEGVEIFPGGDAIQAGLGQRKAGKAALPDLGRGLGDGQVRQRRGG